MNNELELIHRNFPNSQILEDVDVCTGIKKLQQIKREIELLEKSYIEDLVDRTQGENTIIDDFTLTYKSSNLFDKSKVKTYLNQTYTKEEIKKNYVRVEYDNKKVQIEIQENISKKDYIEFFTKKSKPTMKLEKKKLEIKK